MGEKKQSTGKNRKIYVVIATTNDECSCSNRAFWDYTVAWAYIRMQEKATGCEFGLLHLEIEDDNET